MFHVERELTLLRLLSEGGLADTRLDMFHVEH
jgi:hypothetical protein